MDDKTVTSILDNISFDLTAIETEAKHNWHAFHGKPATRVRILKDRFLKLCEKLCV